MQSKYAGSFIAMIIIIPTHFLHKFQAILFGFQINWKADIFSLISLP